MTSRMSADRPMASQPPVVVRERVPAAQTFLLSMPAASPAGALARVTTDTLNAPGPALDTGLQRAAAYFERDSGWMIYSVSLCAGCGVGLAIGNESWNAAILGGALAIGGLRFATGAAIRALAARQRQRRAE